MAIGWALAALHGRARLVAIGVLVVSLLLSFARTGWFGLVAVSAMLAMLQRSRRDRAIALATGLSLVVVLGVFTWLGSDVLTRMTAFEDLSAVERFTTQLDALAFALAHPWFGVGWGFYDVFFGGVEHTAVTFNLYVSIFVGAGLLGLVLFGLFLGTVVRATVRIELPGSWRVGMLFALGAVLFSWITIPGFNFSYMWMALAFAAVPPSVSSAHVAGLTARLRGTL